MRLRAAVVKRSVGRLRLYHLQSTYFVDIDDRALSAIEGALSRGEPPTPECPACPKGEPSDVGCQLIERLQARGLVDDGAYEPVPRREGDLISVEIEPLGRCNLACRHCFVQFSGNEMTEPIFDAALEGARVLGAIELSFNGGEPLLHPRCVDWIERSSLAGLRTVLFTNGTTIDDEIAARLAAAHVARVNVSLDGFEPEHDQLRGEGTFALTVAGIERLVTTGNRVFVTTLVHPANEPTLPEFRRFCKETLGILGMRVSTIFPVGRAASEPGLELPAERIRETYEVLPEPQDFVEPPGRVIPCLAGLDKLYIAADGSVYGCHFFDGLAARMGTLPGNGLAAIHRDSRQTRSCPVLFDHDHQRLETCSSCDMLPRCRGGCRARAWQITGDPHGPDPISCRKWGICPPEKPRSEPRG